MLDHYPFCLRYVRSLSGSAPARFRYLKLADQIPLPHPALLPQRRCNTPLASGATCVGRRDQPSGSAPAAGRDCAWEAATWSRLAPGDSSAPLADFREGRTGLRRQALRNERHLDMKGDD